MSSEVKAIGSLALLYAFRMLGLFMVLPILTLYAREYPGATPMAMGLAIGIYGLTQALFQIPLGLISDFVGRKPVIVLGLVVFAVGSIVSANAESLTGLIIGRALQGSGAIASTIMAMAADLTSEQNRTKAMAAIGASIGLSFTLAIILGPIVGAAGGLAGVFWLSAILAGVGVFIVVGLVPKPPAAGFTHRDSGAVPALLRDVFKSTELMRLNWGIFCLHAVLMACFLVVPGLIQSDLGFEPSQHWLVYLPIMLLSLFVVFPLIMVSERKRKIKLVFVSSIGVLAAAQLSLAFGVGAPWIIALSVFAFFVAFNLLEASLPSLVSKLAPAGSKGTAMGVYSTSQFLGAFVGGSVGGYLLQQGGISLLLLGGAALTVVWIMVAVFMRPPRYLSSLCLPIAQHEVKRFEFDGVVARVGNVSGVAEVLWVEEELLVYLKVDKRELDEVALQLLFEPYNDQSENNRSAEQAPSIEVG